MKGVACLGKRGLPPASLELLNELFTDSILQSEKVNGSGSLEPVEKNSYPASYFLPHNLSEPVSKERVYQYLRENDLLPPTDESGRLEVAVPLDLSPFEKKWKRKFNERDVAPRWYPVCRICKGRKPETSPGAALFYCHDCGLPYHSFCLSNSIKTNVAARYIWSCPSCAVCVVCHAKENESYVVRCDCCDQYWHSYCLYPPRLDLAGNDAFRCRSCTALIGDIDSSSPRESAESTAEAATTNDGFSGAALEQPRATSPSPQPIVSDNMHLDSTSVDNDENMLHEQQQDITNQAST